MEKALTLEKQSSAWRDWWVVLKPHSNLRTMGIHGRLLAPEVAKSIWHAHH